MTTGTSRIGTLRTTRNSAGERRFSAQSRFGRMRVPRVRPFCVPGSLVSGEALAQSGDDTDSRSDVPCRYPVHHVESRPVSKDHTGRRKGFRVLVDPSQGEADALALYSLVCHTWA